MASKLKRCFPRIILQKSHSATPAILSCFLAPDGVSLHFQQRWMPGLTTGDKGFQFQEIITNIHFFPSTWVKDFRVLQLTPSKSHFLVGKTILYDVSSRLSFYTLQLEYHLELASMQTYSCISLGCLPHQIMTHSQFLLVKAK